MSHELMFQERMRKLGNITADFLAHLAGVSGSRLSQAFRGIRSLDNDQTIIIADTLRDLEELATATAPIPISFVNPSKIREVLEKRKSGDLLINIVVKAS
jgi:hypothetical protein